MPRKFIIAGLALVVGLSLFFVFQRPEKGLESSRPASADSEVRVIQVRLRSMPLLLTEAGVLQGWREVDVVAEIPGRVVQPPLEVGTDVAVGELLARLDDTALNIERRSREAGLQRSQLDLRVARREARRLAPLRADGVVSETDWQRVEDTVGQAEAGLAAAEAARDANLQALRHTRIKAPFAGQVVRRYVELGDFLAAGTPVVRLVDLARLRLPVGAPAALAVGIEPGQEARLTVDAYPGMVFEARVHSVGAQAGSTGMFPVELVTVGREGTRLLPGMVARVELLAGRLLPGLLLPTGAALRRDGRDVVFVLGEDGRRVEERAVTLGARHGDTVTVADGLKIGDRVVYQGHAGLDGGDSVRVIDGDSGLPAELRGDAP